uniref:Uncharacterized protein n=1 Tax=Janibacter limosus TaxID=53458 RepID=A0AC61U0W3_9MICO|nr:hypothetical protein [Janibacter limosus]
MRGRACHRARRAQRLGQDLVGRRDRPGVGRPRGVDGLGLPGLVRSGRSEPHARRARPAPARPRRAACGPPRDWLADRPGPLLPITVGHRLVVEGCGSSVGEASPLEGTRVWLDGPADLRRRRAIDRDGPLFEEYWEMWAQQEATLFAADHTRDRAHIILEMDPEAGPTDR